MNNNFFDNEERTQRIDSAGIDKLRLLGQKSLELENQKSLARVQENSMGSARLAQEAERIRQERIQTHLNNERAFVKDSAQGTFAGNLAEGAMHLGAGIFDLLGSPIQTYNRFKIESEIKHIPEEMRELVFRELEPKIFEEQLQKDLKTLEEQRNTNQISAEQYAELEMQLAQKSIDFHSNYQPLSAEESALINQQIQRHGLTNNASAIDRGMNAMNANRGSEWLDENNWFRNRLNQNSGASRAERSAQERGLEISENMTERELAFQEKAINDFMEGDGSVTALEDLSFKLKNYAQAGGEAAQALAEIAVDNPVGALQYGVENLPDVAAFGLGVIPGTVTSVVSSMGDSSRTSNQTFKEQLLKEDGGFFSDKELLTRDLGFAVNTAAESVGDRLVGGVFKPAKDVGRKLKDAANRASEGSDAATAGVNLFSAATNRATALGVAGAGEMVTGAIQSASEQSLMKGDLSTDNIKASEVASGAIIEGLGGLGAAGPMVGLGATGDVIGITVDGVKSKLNKVGGDLNQTGREQRETQERYQSSVESGNMEPINNPEQSDYDYAKVMDAYVKRIQAADATPQEITNLVLDASKQTAVLRTYQMEALATIEQLQGQEDTPENREAIKQLTEAANNFDVAIRKGLNSYAALREKASITQEQLKQIMDEVKAGDDSQRVSILQQAAINPTVFDDGILDDLSSDEGFTPEQRAFFTALRNTESITQLAPGETGAVSQEIIYGNPRNPRQLGIQQYRDHIGTALMSGDTTTAEKYMALLNNFVESQQAKAASLTNAWNTFQQNPRAGEVLSTVTRPVTNPDTKKIEQVPYSIDNRSATFVASAQAEADLLNTFKQEMEALAAVAPQMASTNQSTTQANQSTTSSQQASQANTEAPASTQQTSNQTAEQDVPDSGDNTSVSDDYEAGMNPSTSTDQPVAQPSTATSTNTSNYVPVNEAQTELNAVSSLTTEITDLKKKFEQQELNQTLTDEQLEALDDQVDKLEEKAIKDLNAIVNRLIDKFADFVGNPAINQIIDDLQNDAKNFESDQYTEFSDKIATALNDIKSIENSTFDIFDSNQAQQPADAGTSTAANEQATSSVVDSETPSAEPETFFSTLSELFAANNNEITLGQLLEHYEQNLNNVYAPIYVKVKAKVVREYGLDFKVKHNSKSKNTASVTTNKSLNVDRLLDDTHRQKLAKKHNLTENELAEIVILHELIHVGTLQAIADNVAIENNLKAIAQKISDYLASPESEGLSDHVKNRLTKMAESHVEIPTVGLLEVDVQNVLNNIDGLKEGKTLKDSFLDLLRRIFNIQESNTSLLSDVITMSAQLLSTEVTDNNQTVDEMLAENTSESVSVEDYEAWASQEAPTPIVTQDEADSTTEDSESLESIPEPTPYAANETAANEVLANANGIVQEKFRAKSVNEEGVISTNPVQKEKGLFAKLIDPMMNTSFFANFIGSKQFTKQQQNTLNALKRFSQEFDGVVSELFGNESGIYAAGLLNTDGTIPDALKASMAVASFNFVTTEASETLYNDGDSILSMLGIDDNRYSSSFALRILLGRQGKLQSTVAQNIGKDIVNQLGLTINPEVASEQDLTRLQIELGQVALAALFDMKLVESNYAKIDGTNRAIKMGDLKPLIRALAPKGYQAPNSWVMNVGDNVVLNTVRVVTKKNQGVPTFEMLPKVTSFIEATKGSEQVLSNLFGSQKYRTGPSLEIPKSIPSYMKRTKQKLTDGVKKIINFHQQQTYTLKNELLAVTDRLDGAVKEKFMGLENPEGLHPELAEGIKSKNEGILRGEMFFKDFRNELTEKGKKFFYFEHGLVRQMRMGLLSNTVNPQNDKNHRHYVRQNNWIHTLDKTNEKHMRNFNLAVAQALGVKVDGQPVETSLAEFHKMENSPEFKLAISGLKKVLSDGTYTMTAEENAALLKFNKENMYSLDGMVNYAQMDMAESTFTTDLFTEVDGKTNGPAIGLIQFAGKETVAELKKALAKMGLFFDDTKSYGEWKSVKSHYDAYEQTASQWNKALTKIKEGLVENSPADRVLKTIESINGALVNADDVEIIEKLARQLSKDPTMQTVYGSGAQAQIGLLVDGLIEKLYKEISDAVNYVDQNLTEAELFQARLTKLDEVYGKVQILTSDGSNRLSNVIYHFKAEKNINLQLALHPDRIFSPEDKANMMENVTEHYGNALIEGIDNEYASFKQNRQKFNDAMVTITNLYNDLYTKKTKAKHAELVAAGVIKENDFLPKKYADEIFQELRNAMPVIDSMFTLQEQADRGEYGIFMGKYGEERLTNEQGQVITHFKRPIKYGRGPRDISRQSMRGYLTQQVMVDPGVAPAILSIHSIDAYVALKMAQAFSVLNVYDGFPMSMMNAAEQTQFLNEVFKDVMTNYSLMDQAVVALESAVSLAQENRTKSSDNLLKKAMGQLSQLRTDAAKINEMRTETMNGVTAVTQFVYAENGTHLTGVEPSSDIDGNTPVDELAQKSVEDLNKNNQPPSGDVAVLGQLREEGDTRKIEPTLAAAANRGDIQNVGDLLNIIEAGIKSKRLPHFKGIQALVPIIRRLVPSDVKVVIITPNTPIDSVIPENRRNQENNFKGRWDPSTNTLYLKSDAFLQSGMSYETVMHEMIHAATVAAIAYARTSTDPKVIAAMQDLEKILKLGKDIAESKAKYKKYAPAFQNIEELVAYGLSNKAVQEILQEVQFGKSSALSRVLQSLAKIFASVTNQKPSEVYDGLSALIDSVGVILESDSNPVNLSDTPSFYDDINDANEHVDYMTTKDLFAALENEGTVQASEAQKTHLRNILDNIHNSVPDFDNIVRRLQEGAYENADAYLVHMKNDTIPVLSNAIVNGFTLSAQEQMVLEHVELITREGLEADKALRSKAMDLYLRAAEELTLNDFANNPSMDLDNPQNASEREIAQRRYDYVFKPVTQRQTVRSTTSVTGQSLEVSSDYLNRFVSLGATNEQFNTALGRVNVVDDPTSFGEKVASLFRQVMAWFAGVMGKEVNAAQGNQRLIQLMGNFASIRTKNQSKVLGSMLDQLKTFENKGNALIEHNRKKLSSAIRKAVQNQAKNDTTRGLLTIAQSIVDNEVKWSLRAGNQLINRTVDSQQSILAETITEHLGRQFDNKTFHALFTKTKHLLQQAKLSVEKYKRDVVNQAFENPLTDVQKNALTKGVLETGLQDLVDHMSMADIELMVSDRSARNNKINTLQTELNNLGINPKVSLYYQNAVEVLGRSMATGNWKSSVVGKNAYAIARMFGTPYSNRPVLTKLDQAESIIDQLASLHALNHVNSDNLTAVSNLMRSEANRTDGRNGVEFTMKLVKGMREEALLTRFDNDRSKMTKGYRADDLNHHRQLVVVELDPNGQLPIEYQRKGYKTIEGEIIRDPNDPDNVTKVLAYSDSDAKQSWLSATMSLTAEMAKGTKLRTASFSPENPPGMFVYRNEIKSIQAKNNPELSEMMSKRITNWDHRKGNRLVPNYNDKGQVVDYSYQMSSSIKDSVMERQNAIDRVIGQEAMQNLDKVESRKINDEVVVQLKKAYEEDFVRGNRAREFIMVGPNSPDSKMRELYKMLPYATKKKIKEVWKGEDMLVRKDLVRLVFGFRKLGITDWWNLGENEKKAYQEIITNTLDMMTNGNAYKWLNRGEKIWEDAMAKIKDVVVIKSLIVPLYNAISNLSVLWWEGVPIKDMGRLHREGYEGFRKYQKLQAEVSILNDEIAYNTNINSQERAKLVRKLNALETELSKNDVKEMMDAGLFLTIIEDVDQTIDPFNEHSVLNKMWDQKVVNNLPDNLQKAVRSGMEKADQALLSKGSVGYQLSAHFTQASDFVSRYALIKYHLETKKSKMSKHEIFEQARERFINYDLPTHPIFQKLNDLGLAWFTKYYFRVQKQIGVQFENNPMRGIAMLAVATAIFPTAPFVLGGSYLLMSAAHRVQNPLGMLESVNDIATVKATQEILDL